MPSRQPSGLKKVGSKEFQISWSDGHLSVYSVRYLRQRCQCALCVDEWSGKPLLARDSIPEGLECLGAQLVGQYALQFRFSDGHSTGIYTFEHLRGICPCPDCKKLPLEPEGKEFLDKEDLRRRP